MDGLSSGTRGTTETGEVRKRHGLRRLRLSVSFI